MVSTNNAQTIWVQDQLFVDWTSVWTWMRSIECEITRKTCSINLVQQKIRMENVFAKSFEQIDELINESGPICSRTKTIKQICGKIL